LSFLSKFGKVVLSIFGVAGKIEKIIEKPVEAIVPASTIAFNIFDTGVEIAKDVEAAFAAAGQQSNGSAKLAAALPGFSAALDAYTLAKFPGSDQILQAEAYLASKTALINAIVQYLNSLPESVQITPSSSAIVAAAAVSAATKKAA
jgi:hypothetical protein